MSRTSTEVRRLALSGSTMGSRWSAVIHAAGEHDLPAIGAALAAAVGEVDDAMSTWKPGSALMQLNRAPVGQWVPVPRGLACVLDASLAIGRLTEGRFDIGVGAAVAAFGFGAPLPDGPAYDARGLALDLLEVDVTSSRARRLGPCALDLSGIAKGHGVDCLARCLDGLGFDSYLVGIDGELRSRGLRPDGTPYAIAVEQPREGVREAMGVIALQDRAVATSGDYRHVAKRNGKRVSHTIDPRTGEPAEGLASVSVLAGTAMEADALATALMVAGPQDGPALARRLGVEALFAVRTGADVEVTGTGCFAPA